MSVFYYSGTVRMLSEMVRDETIDVLEVDSNFLEGRLGTSGHTCYSCQKPIKSKVRLLIQRGYVNGRHSTTRYPIDSACFSKMKWGLL